MRRAGNGPERRIAAHIGLVDRIALDVERQSDMRSARPPRGHARGMRRERRAGSSAARSITLLDLVSGRNSASWSSSVSVNLPARGDGDVGGDREHRDRGFVRLDHARHHVGGAAAGGPLADADASGDPRIAVRHVGGVALVARQDVGHAVIEPRAARRRTAGWCRRKGRRCASTPCAFSISTAASPPLSWFMGLPQCRLHGHRPAPVCCAPVSQSRSLSCSRSAILLSQSIGAGPGEPGPAAAPFRAEGPRWRSGGPSNTSSMGESARKSITRSMPRAVATRSRRTPGAVRFAEFKLLLKPDELRHIVDAYTLWTHVYRAVEQVRRAFRADSGRSADPGARRDVLRHASVRSVREPLHPAAAHPLPRWLDEEPRRADLQVPPPRRRAGSGRRRAPGHRGRRRASSSSARSCRSPTGSAARGTSTPATA